MPQISYTVDIVMCIDATGGTQPFIGSLKTGALSLYEDFQKLMEGKNKYVNQLRIRAIVFRNFKADGPNAFVETPFYHFPEQTEQFSNFINTLVSDGGGDEPENALEALDVAIRSAWTKEGDRKRQVIVLWTDASAHHLENANRATNLYRTSCGFRQ